MLVWVQMPLRERDRGASPHHACSLERASNAVDDVNVTMYDFKEIVNKKQIDCKYQIVVF